jgi:cell wall-associated NlpC family hydrolase
MNSFSDYAAGITIFVFLFTGCLQKKPEAEIPLEIRDANSTATAIVDTPKFHQPPQYYKQGTIIETGATKPAELISFAKTMIGTPYLYASTDPAKGFDCSGFITFVYNHFNIIVPRSSVDFTGVGREMTEGEAAPGDLILFTGTDSTIRVVGHMGIIVSNENGQLAFIHSTSGKAKGVVITAFENYYRSRFVKIIRVFPGKYAE